MNEQTKFCEYCGNQVHIDAVICPKCGRQLEELKTSTNNTDKQVIINNINNNAHSGKKCDKWVAFLLCFFLGVLGAHKFYEGKAGMGILYIFTAGLFGIGWIIDCITILCRPNPYYI